MMRAMRIQPRRVVMWFTPLTPAWRYRSGWQVDLLQRQSNETLVNSSRLSGLLFTKVDGGVEEWEVIQQATA
jgi:hypothetical protein